RLAQVFGLSRFEVDLLQACAALSWDPALAKVAAYLHDHAGRPYLTYPLVARLYGHERGGVRHADSALFRWELARWRELGPGEPHAIECDPQICDWLRGQPMLDPALV